jgi:Cof subfamily protein (haloacid dehalogenase superfamily)
VIQLIAMDVDGTLVGSDANTISPKNLQALQKAYNQGVVLAIASGRPYAFIETLLYQIPEVEFVIYGNGAGIYDQIKHEEFDMPDTDMNIADSIFIADVLQQYPAHVQVQAEGKLYISQASMDYFEARFHKRVTEAGQSSIAIVPDALEVARKIPTQKFNVEFIDLKARPQALAKLLTRPSILISSSWQDNVEINSRNATKGRALETLAKHLNIPQENVLAIGDNINDLEMIEYAGIGVAVRNAVPEALAIADYITSSNEHNGVAKAVLKYLK